MKKKIMKNLTFLFLFIVLVVYSCDRYEYPVTELKVNELYTYCEKNGRLPCNELLNHEGDLVTVIGYYRVSYHKNYVNGNKFQFFDAPTIGSLSTEITINGNFKSVFDKISKIIDTNSSEDHVKLKVSGKIVGQDLPINGDCSRGVFLEIDNSFAIRAD